MPFPHSSLLSDTNELALAAGLDRPTPRAISERIFKIRATAKASGTATHFSVPSANTATPRKKAPNGTAKKAPPKKTNGAKVGAGKRKRGGMMSDEYVHLLLYFGSTCNTNIRKGEKPATTPNKTASNLTTTTPTPATTRLPRRRPRPTALLPRARARIRPRSSWKMTRRKTKPSTTRATRMPLEETVMRTSTTLERARQRKEFEGNRRESKMTKKMGPFFL